MVIVGQMLNLGQFKVTVQGHLEVNLHQEWPGGHTAFWIFLIGRLEPNIFSFVLSDRSQEKSKFNRTQKHWLYVIKMPVTLEIIMIETKFEKHIILDISRIWFRYSMYLFSSYIFVMWYNYLRGPFKRFVLERTWSPTIFYIIQYLINQGCLMLDPTNMLHPPPPCTTTGGYNCIENLWGTRDYVENMKGMWLHWKHRGGGTHLAAFGEKEKIRWGFRKDVKMHNCWMQPKLWSVRQL